MPVDGQAPSSIGDVQDALGELGLAMLGAGFAVTDIQTALEHAAVSADSDLVIGTLPSGLLIDSPQLGRTRLYSQPNGTSLRWDQAAEVSMVAAAAGAGQPVSTWTATLRQSLQSKPAHGPVVASIGCGVQSAGIAVVFGISAVGMLAAAVFGALVGASLIWSGRSPRLTSVLPLFWAFAISTILFSLGDHVGLGHSPLFAICAPLVVLIPGAMITNGVIELAAGDMVSGSARIASGLLIWAMLAIGVVAGAAVCRVDVNSLALVPSGDFPSWAPWIALLAIAGGIHLFFSTGLLLTVSTAVSLEVAYSLQRILTPGTGAIVAAGITAAITLLLARIVERSTPRLPSIVTFRPSFWILVPGSLGLVALTEVATSPSPSSGLGWSVAATVVAIGIGVQVGAFVSEFIPPRALHPGQ